jgi:heme/copper-type cytochrome/quinol oxidase subunit 2
MFVVIVVIAVIIGLLFFTVAISLISFIYNGIKKNEAAKKKSFWVLVPSAIVWILLIALNTILIITFFHKNKEEILDKAVRIPAEIAGKGLALAYQSLEKNWDQGIIQQFQNLNISPSTMNYVVKDKNRIYDIELIFDNTSPTEIKLYLSDIIRNNYLVVCDKDDFVYLLEPSSQRTNTIIPFGKSKLKFMVTAPKDVEITHARFINTIIQLK